MERFFCRDAEEVARDLLGKVLVVRKGGKEMRGRIVETEAYFDFDDPASRARQNGDLRKTMLMKPGTILVYGVHNSWLINFVCSENKAAAVLIRAVEPLNFEADTKGPGKLTKVFGIDKGFHKKNLLECEEIFIEDSFKEEFEVGESFRIGVKEDLKKEMRFFIKGNKFVSR